MYEPKQLLHVNQVAETPPTRSNRPPSQALW